MSVFSVTTVRPVSENGFGWLTCGVELIVTDRLPCATAQASSVTDWFITTEPVRALITTLAAGVARATSRFSMSARKATRASVDAGMRTRTTRPSSACAVPLPIRALIERTTSRAVLKSLRVEVELQELALAQRRRHAALDGGALGNAAGTQVVDLHLGAAGRGAGAADDQVALRQRVDLAVGALQRRRDQRAAAQALGVAHRRDVDVDRLAGLRERRQLRGDHHRRDVLQLHVGAGRHRDAHLLQQRVQALRRERR